MRQAARRIWPGWRGMLAAACLMLVALAATLAGAATPGAAIADPGLALQASRFEEPLVPTTETSAEEDAALAAAIAAYHAAAAVDDFSALEGFLASHPRSGWRVAVLTNLGLSYYHYAYFSKSIDAFQQAWDEGKSATELHAKALVDRAAGELLRMHARVGHADTVAALLEQMGDRGLTGMATEWRAGAREGLWEMRNNPGVAYLCGPMALKNLLLASGSTPEQVAFLDAYRSGPHGVTLAEVGRLAAQAKLPYRLIHRVPGEPVPVPSVVNWKVHHFAAIIGMRDGRYELADPTFAGPHMWVTRAAIDAEASGYFLVAKPQPGAAWRDATPEEAEQVYGMGFPGLSWPGATGAGDSGCGGSDGTGGTGGSGGPGAGGPPPAPCGGSGMTTYRFTEMLVSLNLNDSPVGYKPPVGPDVHVKLSYNQREASQPANFSFFNVSQKWSLNWLSYIEDDPSAPGASVQRDMAGGGFIYETGYNASTGSFASENYDGSVLSVSTTGPVTYTRNLPDGGMEVYGQSNGATTYPRLVFLSQRIDRFGNAVTLHYDALLRLSSITDAIGQSTTFAYANASFPLQITKVTDPFGRSAQLAYDSSGRLSRITDVLGLTSSFTYDGSSLINALKTPYGTTMFQYNSGNSTGASNERYLQATDPLLATERLEYAQGVISANDTVPPPQGILGADNTQQNERDTFYWNKNAYSSTTNYLTARNKHWAYTAGLNGPGGTTSNTLESIKYPSENRIWYNYPGQPTTLSNGASFAGTLLSPTAIARVLDDGSTQLTRRQYNGLGNPTSGTDPVGRTTILNYAPNQIDVTSVQQASAAGAPVIARYTYNAQHEPLTITDAAGQTTHYGYNAVGQLTSVTDALGETTTYNHNPQGYLTSIVNANGRTAASFTYDGYGRVATFTDSEGWSVSYQYDALDHLLRETFPDGTARVIVYDPAHPLDVLSVTDRQGRTTTYGHDANRNLTSITDPAGNVTQLNYTNDVLRSMVDPNGNVTTWTVDIEGRVTGKTFADGGAYSYAYEATTSRLHAIIDALGQAKQYSYYADNRLAGIQYTGINPTPSVSFGYDTGFPRLTFMTDGFGTTQYSYQPVGALGALQLAQETPPFANSAITYGYDALGRVTNRAVGGDAESVIYDALGRVTSHASDLGTFQRFYFDQTGQLTGQRDGNVGTRWLYDTNLNDRRLTGIANSPGASHFGYTTTPEYDFQQITESRLQQTWTYSYDPADRLVQAGSSLGAAYRYGYDPASNLGAIQVQNNSGTITSSTSIAPGPVNEVASVGTSAFTYDANGNLLADTSRSYTWDAENRLLSITGPGYTSTFGYDGLGRRVAINDSGSETHLGWCGQTLCQKRDGLDNVTRRYFDEGEADLTDSSLLYKGVDHLGSVRDVIALPGGLRTNHFDYDPYGNPTTTLGARLTWTDLRYAGLFYHQPSGLYLATHRAYNPAIGRWISRDPIGEYGGINLYAYVEGNPLNRIDPWGLFSVTVSGGAAGFGGSVSVSYSSSTGQWSVGAWGGVGAGLSVRGSSADSGCQTPGFHGSVRGQANWNLGQAGGGSVGLQVSSSGTPTFSGSYSFGNGGGLGGSVTVVSPGDDGSSGSYSGNGGWTGGYGSSAFIGAGGSYASNGGGTCGCH